MTALHHPIDALKARVARARKAFDARAPRERLLMICTAVALTLWAADSLWITPASKLWSAARARHNTATASLQRLNDDIAQQGANARAIEAQLTRDVQQLRERVERGDAELRQVGTTLIPASDMLPVLEHLLTQVGGLRLRSMQSLGRSELTGGAQNPGAITAPVPPAGSASAPAAASATAPMVAQARADGSPVLYRHGFEIVLEGGYADLLSYLRALEAMPQRVLWGGLRFKVDRHPRAVLTLRLYTLSLDRSWLEI